VGSGESLAVEVVILRLRGAEKRDKMKEVSEKFVDMKTGVSRKVSKQDIEVKIEEQDLHWSRGEGVIAHVMDWRLIPLPDH
jgi:hypothetical protein